jgi:hypothetical protein
MKKILLVLLVMVLVSGCAYSIDTKTPLIKETKSNKAEGLFIGQSIDEVRNLISGYCLDKGWNISLNENTYAICSYKLDSHERNNDGIRVHDRHMQFNTIEIDNGIRVVIQQWFAHETATSITKDVSADHHYRNDMQKFLAELGAE